MSFPPDLFVQADSYSLQCGRLILVDGKYALSVNTADKNAPDINPLMLEGERLGYIEDVIDSYRCCMSTPSYGLKAKAIGRPRPLRVDDLRAGELIFTGKATLVFGVLDGSPMGFLLNGDRATISKEDSVVYSAWEIWATGSNGEEVGTGPLATVMGPEIPPSEPKQKPKSEHFEDLLPV